MILGHRAQAETAAPRRADEGARDRRVAHAQRPEGAGQALVMLKAFRPRHPAGRDAGAAGDVLAEHDHRRIAAHLW